MIEYNESRQDDGLRACHCIGPQNGDPVCPCRMRNVRTINGRRVEVTDLGPAEDDVLAKRFMGAGPLVGQS